MYTHIRICYIFSAFLWHYHGFCGKQLDNVYKLVGNERDARHSVGLVQSLSGLTLLTKAQRTNI